MTYYSTWQEALAEFITKYGHNYKDAYNLATEFEMHIKQNIKGSWYMLKDPILYLIKEELK